MGMAICREKFFLGVDKYKDMRCGNQWEGVLRDHPNDEKCR